MLNEWFALVIFQSLDKQNHHAILIYLCVSSKFDLLQQFIKACIKIIGNSAMMKGGVKVVREMFAAVIHQSWPFWKAKHFVIK